MKYNTKIKEGIFISRPNRFIAQVMVDGEEKTVHVKNTGRCRELLVSGCKVYLAEAENPKRKTPYDLIATQKERSGKPPLLINMDSQIPNSAAEEWLKKGNIFSKNATVRREVFFGNSRFDIYVEDGERKAFVEVKGVTLENDGVVSFPDAPTERGIKHLGELQECVRAGYEAYILFVVQMKGVSLFVPNSETHPQFAEALKKAQSAGVNVVVMDCIVTENSITIDKEVRYRI
ncbi:MAG: DNA/RNA nuclease SfsA [Clostridia bacterium]|nr:DNA/RNA nuclease SfsA [Clostridia bacterium]